jgi:hypothetical protein
MDQSHKLSDFVIPPTTSAVLLPWSWQPSFVQNSTKFERAAYDPTRLWLVTERLDPKDEPKALNYNYYCVSETSRGTFLSGPLPTPTTFIGHQLPAPSTWFNSLPYV